MGIRTRSFVLFSGLLFSFFHHQTLKAYTYSITSDGKSLKWASGSKLPLAGNPGTQSSITQAYFKESVVKGLQRWKQSAANQIRFDYWQGSDSSNYPTNSNMNGLSSIYFISNSKDTMGSGLIGLTQVWYDTSTGQIFEADISLNDRTYNFTNDPRDTSAQGAGRVFLQNVLTHELGHAFGLSHGASLQSTMLFQEAKEQFLLSCDDTVGIRSLYPGATRSVTGTLSGKVVTPSGAGLFGAHVVAISAARGTVLASAMTNKNGDYQINQLESGSYYLMVEPYYSGGSNLSNYYSSLNHRICDGDYFKRTFMTNGSGSVLKSVQVRNQQVNSVSNIQVNCDEVNHSRYGSSLSQNAPIINPASTGRLGIVDQFSNDGFFSNEPMYYELNQISGDLEIHFMSFSLYSPIQVQAELLDEFGNSVNAQISTPTFVGQSGFSNYDTHLKAESLSHGNYLLKLTPVSVSGQSYPAGWTALDNRPYFLILGSLGSYFPKQTATDLEQNSRCSRADSFPSYTSPGGSPERSTIPQGEQSTGFCGMVRKNFDGKGPGPIHPSVVINWFLPFGLLAIYRMWMASRRRGLRRSPPEVNL